jgi:hypothetical protein
MILDNLLQVAAADPQLCRDLVHGVENGNHVCLSLTHATGAAPINRNMNSAAYQHVFKRVWMIEMSCLPVRKTDTLGKLLWCSSRSSADKGPPLFLLGYP